MSRSVAAVPAPADYSHIWECSCMGPKAWPGRWRCILGKMVAGMAMWTHSRMVVCRMTRFVMHDVKQVPGKVAQPCQGQIGTKQGVGAKHAQECSRNGTSTGQ